MARVAMPAQADLPAAAAVYRALDDIGEKIFHRALLLQATIRVILGTSAAIVVLPADQAVALAEQVRRALLPRTRMRVMRGAKLAVAFLPVDQAPAEEVRRALILQAAPQVIRGATLA
jgi:hypothetical protein